jgi:hypothetical protein
LYSTATAIYQCTKSELAGAKQPFGIQLLKIMQSLLAKFLHSLDKHDQAWWFKVKIKPKPDVDMSLTLDEVPIKHCLSKLLGITMNQLWDVLIACNLDKKMGKRGNILDWDAFQHSLSTMDLPIRSDNPDIHTQHPIQPPQCLSPMEIGKKAPLPL